MSDRERPHSDGFATAHREQGRRIVAALSERTELDATPIVREGEIQYREAYVTLLYELHHVHLPELQAEGVVEFDRLAETVTRGPDFEKRDDARKFETSD